MRDGALCLHLNILDPAPLRPNVKQRPMQIYWTSKSIPELRDLEPSQRRAVWRACCLQPFRHWQTWAAFVGQFATMLIGAIAGLSIDGHTWILLGGSPPDIEKMRFPTATVFLALAAGIVSVMLFTQVLSHMVRPYLKRHLETHHAA